MADLIDTLTNEALCHKDECECVVCRAVGGDKAAMEQCVVAYYRPRGGEDG